MAGHSKWKNIQRTKSTNDQLRSKEFAKLVRAIELAAQSGSDPKLNPSLADAIDRAKKQNLPKDRIERAISKGSGNSNTGQKIEKIIYEGYGPHGVMLLVECLTDNKNRCFTELKTFFGKNNCKLVEEGSISWRFCELGMIELDGEIGDGLLAKLIEIDGITDITAEDGLIYTNPSMLNSVKEKVRSFCGNIKDFKICWKSREKQVFSNSQLEEIHNFISKLHTLNDVEEIWW
ncbi:hypothetical protein D6810_02535 [Candidatus Dojkabacteria bacterium]|uniref:Probable transcriptional regulatory protein D6810_02535 n=1 Tax=Candidatus Dojkabacteria bacterium TaxID=2099670 RepID=A0A3M0Z0B2_9BACT|nr:MAG: hypothetical protein D6810_02535 [Candidatus Dojkabacteria bacterium]